jgi:Dehydrogenase E1 component
VLVFCAQARDPIPTFRKWALEQGLLSDGKVKEIEAAVTAEVEDSVKFADESPKPVSVKASFRGSAWQHACCMCQGVVEGGSEHRNAPEPDKLGLRGRICPTGVPFLTPEELYFWAASCAVVVDTPSMRIEHGAMHSCGNR